MDLLSSVFQLWPADVAMAAQPLQPVATRAAAQSSPRHPRAMTVAVAGARKAVVAAAGSSLSSPRRPMGPVNNGLRRSPRLGRPADALSPAHKAAVTVMKGKEVRWHICYRPLIASLTLIMLVTLYAGLSTQNRDARRLPGDAVRKHVTGIAGAPFAP